MQHRRPAGVTQICFVNTAAADMRFFQSSRPDHAAAGRPGHDRGRVHLRGAGVGRGSCPSIRVRCQAGRPDAAPHSRATPPGWPGVNAIDTVMGYRGFNGRRPRPDRSSQDEVGHRARARCSARPRWPRRCSTASSCCRSPRERRSSSWSRATARSPCSGGRRPRETEGDAVLPVARQPTTDGAQGGCTIPTTASIDVEGYRVYRGRTDIPSDAPAARAVRLRRGTAGIFTDFRALINPRPGLRAGAGRHGRLPGGVSAPAPPGDGSPDSVGMDLDRHDRADQVGRPRARWPTARPACPAAGHGDRRRRQRARRRCRDNGVPFVFTDDGTGGGSRRRGTACATSTRSPRST